MYSVECLVLLVPLELVMSEPVESEEGRIVVVLR